MTATALIATALLCSACLGVRQSGGGPPGAGQPAGEGAADERTVGSDEALEPTAEPTAETVSDVSSQDEELTAELGTVGASRLVPVVPGYKTLDEGELLELAAGLAGAIGDDDGGSAGGGDGSGDEGDGALGSAAALLACYREAGAIAARAYVAEDQVSSVGGAMIIDPKALHDPMLFIRCAGTQMIDVFKSDGVSALSDAEPIEPCKHEYDLEADETTYRIHLFGTTRSVCADLCGALEGCTLPPDSAGEAPND